MRKVKNGLEKNIRESEKMINKCKEIRSSTNDKFVIDSINRILDELREFRRCMIRMRKNNNEAVEKTTEFILELRKQDVDVYVNGGV